MPLDFESVKNLYAFRDSFLLARFRHKRRNAADSDKYDLRKVSRNSNKAMTAI